MSIVSMVEGFECWENSGDQDKGDWECVHFSL